jgi:hypothetical protein
MVHKIIKHSFYISNLFSFIAYSGFLWSGYQPILTMITCDKDRECKLNEIKVKSIPNRLLLSTDNKYQNEEFTTSQRTTESSEGSCKLLM